MDDIATVDAGQTIAIQVVANDVEGTGDFDLSSLTVVTSPTLGTVVPNSDGSFTYTSPITAEGIDTFTYTIRSVDGGTSNTATVAVTVIGDNTPPVPTLTTTATNADNGVTVRVVATFSEDVTGFDASDVVVLNGAAATNFVALNAREYTFDVTDPNAAPVRVSIPPGAALDAAGNESVASNGIVLPSLNDPSWQTVGTEGLRIWDLVPGTGAVVQTGDRVNTFYRGWLTNGNVFNDFANGDPNNPGTPISFTLTTGPGGVIRGFAEGLVGMQVGGTRRIFIPSALGYGSVAQSGIPANSNLFFDVRILSVG